jgi:hypothetical protein
MAGLVPANRRGTVPLPMAGIRRHCWSKLAPAKSPGRRHRPRADLHPDVEPCLSYEITRDRNTGLIDLRASHRK